MKKIVFIKLLIFIISLSFCFNQDTWIVESAGEFEYGNCTGELMMFPSELLSCIFQVTLNGDGTGSLYGCSDSGLEFQGNLEWISNEDSLIVTDGSCVDNNNSDCNDEQIYLEEECPDECSWQIEETILYATENNWYFNDYEEGQCEEEMYETSEDCEANGYEWEDESCIYFELSEGELDCTGCFDQEGCESDDDCEDDEVCEDSECIYDNGDGPPACIEDCPDFELLSNYMDPNDFCSIVASWDGNSCLDDCLEYEASDINEYIAACSECIEYNNCEELFEEDEEYCDPTDETGGEAWYCCSCDCNAFDPYEDCLESEYNEGTCQLDCGDGGDDEIPECLYDCVISMPSDTYDMEALCDWVESMETSDCADDCSDEDAEEWAMMLVIYSMICSEEDCECDVSDNCDIIFNEYGEYDGDCECDEDCDDGEAPECVSDCEGINEVGEPGDPGFCEWITALDGSCYSDCEGDEAGIISEVLDICEECLVENNCEDAFDDDGDIGECEEHSDCDSNYCNADGECIDCPYEYDCNGECGGGDWSCEEDDGAPECMLDCDGIYDVDPSDDADAFCNWLISIDPTDCMMDCDNDIMDHIIDMMIACETCLENDNYNCEDALDDDESCESDDDCESGESYIDENGNGEYDEGESYIDENANGEYDEGEECIDGECFDGDDGPPTCIQDCPDFDLLDGDSDLTADESCEIISSWGSDGCIDDCLGEDLEIINMYVWMCTECLADDNYDCEEALDDDGCETDDDCNDDEMCWDGECITDDDGPPECILDCEGIEEVASPDDDANEFCEWFINIDSGCLYDCDEDVNEELTFVFSLCELCVNDEYIDCNDVWPDEDEDDCISDGEDSCESGNFTDQGSCENNIICEWDDYYGECYYNCEFDAECECDDGGEDGPPECVLDCEGIEEIDPDEDIIEFCDWILGLDGICYDDCENEDAEEINELLSMCETLELGLSKPLEYTLLSPYPNPFNPETTISYKIEKSDFVSINIYDINGKLVKNLINEIKPSGQHFVVWNASNFPSGLYFIRMVSSDYISIEKALLVK